MMIRRVHPIHVGLILVALILCTGLVVGGSYLFSGDTSAPPESNDPGLAVSSSGPTCLDEAVKPHGGWIHGVAHGEEYDITFNATIAHEPDEEVDAEIAPVGSNTYEIRITTGQITDDELRSDLESNNCERGTQIKGGTSVPADLETVRVVVNGEEVQTLDREGTFPTLRKLPNPVDL